MTARDVMTSGPAVVAPTTTIAEAAALMLAVDCGVLPVVENDRLVSTVTDRDLFIALATRNVLASQLTVGEVARHEVWTCGPDDAVRAALDTMRQHQVRRLPVVDAAGHVVGIVSMNDVLLALDGSKAIAPRAVIDTLQHISAHHHLPSRFEAP